MSLNIIIDPGEKNLAIQITELNEIHYFKNNNTKLNLDLIKIYIYPKIKNFSKINLIIEKQFINKNIYIEGIIIGFLYNMFDDLNVQRINSKIKSKICEEIFKFQYSKLTRQKIKYAPVPFIKSLNLFKIIKYEQMKINETNIKNENKIDDIVDVFIMGHYSKIYLYKCK